MVLDIAKDANVEAEQALDWDQLLPKRRRVVVGRQVNQVSVTLVPSAWLWPQITFPLHHPPPLDWIRKAECTLPQPRATSAGGSRWCGCWRPRAVDLQISRASTCTSGRCSTNQLTAPMATVTVFSLISHCGLTRRPSTTWFDTVLLVRWREGR